MLCSFLVAQICIILNWVILLAYTILINTPNCLILIMLNSLDFLVSFIVYFPFSDMLQFFCQGTVIAFKRFSSVSPFIVISWDNLNSKSHWDQIIFLFYFLIESLYLNTSLKCVWLNTIYGVSYSTVDIT